MTKFTISVELDTLATINSRGIEAQVDVTKLNADTVAKLVMHGIGQKVGDAASQATALAVKDKFGDKAKPIDHKPFIQSTDGKNAIATHTKALMDKAAEGLEANQWSMRGSGTSAVSEETLVQRLVTRPVYKRALDDKAWEDFLAMDKGEQNAKLDEVWAKNESALRPAYDVEMENRARKRSLADIKITL